MINIMKLLTIYLAFINVGLASEDVTCWSNSCLHNGWTVVDSQLNRFVDYGCYRDGCSSSGWIVSSPLAYYTQCKEQNCFQKGWYEIDRYTQEMIHQVQCLGPKNSENCLKNGWVVYGKVGMVNITRCQRSDCNRNGWSTQYNDGTISRSTCKKSGCFVAGWITQ